MYKTFKEYQYQLTCTDPEKYDWDAPIVEGSEEWLDAIEGENIQEVQKGSISAFGLAFSALTLTLPIYLRYKVMRKHIEKAKAGCTGKGVKGNLNPMEILKRNKCLYDFRKKGYEAKIKMLTKVMAKEKGNPDKVKKINKEIAQAKDQISDLRVNF